MYYPATYPRRQPGLPNVSQQVRQWLRTLLPPPTQPVQLQPGDAYVLDAGHYHLCVQAGSVWVPEVGIFSAGERMTLTVDAAGLAIHSYAQQAAVLTVRGA